jgi:hypothetical protein
MPYSLDLISLLGDHPVLRGDRAVPLGHAVVQRGDLGALPFDLRVLLGDLALLPVDGARASSRPRPATGEPWTTSSGHTTTPGIRRAWAVRAAYRATASTCPCRSSAPQWTRPRTRAVRT